MSSQQQQRLIVYTPPPHPSFYFEAIRDSPIPPQRRLPLAERASVTLSNHRCSSPSVESRLACSAIPNHRFDDDGDDGNQQHDDHDHSNNDDKNRRNFNDNGADAAAAADDDDDDDEYDIIIPSRPRPRPPQLVLKNAAVVSIPDEEKDDQLLDTNYHHEPKDIYCKDDVNHTVPASFSWHDDIGRVQHDKKGTLLAGPCHTDVVGDDEDESDYDDVNSEDGPLLPHLPQFSGDSIFSNDNQHDHTNQYNDDDVEYDHLVQLIEDVEDSSHGENEENGHDCYMPMEIDESWSD